MMKKNFSKYFMIAVVAVTMGFVSSCKDYEDEMVAEFRGEDVALKGSINNLKSDLEKGLADAKAERDALEQKLTDEINTVKELYATKAELEAAKNEHDADIAALDAKIAGVDADLQATKTKLEDTIGRLTLAETKINTLEAVVTELKAKDEAIDKAIQTLNDEQAAQDAKIKAIEEVTIPLINSEISTLKGRADALETKAAAHDKAIEDVNKLIEELGLEDERIEGLVTKAQEDATKAISLSTALKAALDEAEKDLNDKITANAAEIVKNADAITKNADAITALEAADAAAAAKMADLSDSLKNAYDSIAANATAIALLDEKLNDAVAALEDSIQAVEEKMQDQIDALAADLDSLEARVLANEEAIKELTKDLDNLTEAFKKRITNISIQGAYSPVLGYFNMPMGVKSNVLAAYQGAELENTTTTLKFPFAYSESVVAGFEPIAESVLNKLNPTTLDIEPGDIVGQNEDGMTYAGKVYMVVNPNEVDLTDVTFNVVNSLGEAAPVTLDSVVKSTDKLTFGYTRAGAALYEATARVNAEEANVNLNVADYKDIFSDLKNRELNIADIASTLYRTFNNIADANAVSASWTDSLGEHTVMSDYALAAVSVKPLSFNFISTLAANVNFNKTISLDKAYAIIDKVAAELKSKFSALPSGIKIESIDVDKIKFTLPDVDLAKELEGMVVIKPGTVLGSYDFNNDGSIGEDEKIKVGAEGIKIENLPEGQYVITIPTTDLENQIKDIVAPINGMISNLQPILGPVNALLAQLKANEGKFNTVVDKSENIASKLVAGIEKVVNNLDGLVNKADAFLRPVLLLDTPEGFSVLSQSANQPATIANGAVFVATSYNAELLVPIYKKYVAVTKAWDKAGNEADIASANTGRGFNEVLEGDAHSIALNGQSGYTYEITYSALDFHGYVVNTKYYVTVK